MNLLNQTGLLRIWQIVGDAKRNLPPRIPISRSAWWAGVKTGRYPAPVKLSPRTTCWRAEDVYALINKDS
jgi:prophage regulatory protein